MTLKPEYSHGNQNLLEAAAAIVKMATSEEHLKQICSSVWSGSGFYRGGTHLRVIVRCQPREESFYVDLTA